jgi:hypothetical protein
MPVPDDFDPTHALDGWRAPAPAPLDLDLRVLQPSRRLPATDAKRQAWLKQHGFDMSDVQDVEVHDAPPASAPAAEPPPLDLPAPAPAPDPRLRARWQPDAWQGLTRPLSGAAAELHPTAGGLQVEHRAAQWLCAAWPPQAEGAVRDRWPTFAALIEGDSAVAAWTSLLGELPPDAPLWVSHEAADWALIAELVLAQDTSLRPPQVTRLHELVQEEREACRARIAQGYVRSGRVARAQA